LIEDGRGLGDDALPCRFTLSHGPHLASFSLPTAYRKKDASVSFLMNLMMKETEWFLLSASPEGR